MRALVIVLLLFAATNSADVLTVVVQGNTNPNFYLPYALGTFTLVPFGEHIVGRLVILSNNLCDSTNLPIISVASPYVLLVERGGCEFTKKTLNANSLGAKMLIISDNGTATQPPVMRISTALQTVIQMPVVSITLEAGQKLKDLITTSPIVNIEASFLVAKTARPQVRLLMHQGNYTYLFVDNLSTAFVGSLKSSFDLATPVYKILESCDNCAATDCLSNGIWCVKALSDSLLTGKQYVEEALRQSFILDVSQAAWWVYMKEFKTNCFSSATFSGCVPSAMMATAGLAQADIDHVESQVQTEVSNANANTSRLFVWRDTLRNESIVDYFGVKINGVNYPGVGALNPDSVLRMLCASYTTPPAECSGKLPVQIILNQTTSLPRAVNSSDITLKAIGILNLQLTTEWFKSE